jgi:hypothetical protein
MALTRDKSRTSCGSKAAQHSSPVALSSMHIETDRRRLQQQQTYKIGCRILIQLQELQPRSYACVLWKVLADGRQCKPAEVSSNLSMSMHCMFDLCTRVLDTACVHVACWEAGAHRRSMVFASTYHVTPKMSAVKNREKNILHVAAIVVCAMRHNERARVLQTHREQASGGMLQALVIS